MGGPALILIQLVSIFSFDFAEARNSSSEINLIVLGTGGPSVVTEGKDALLTCVIMGLFQNDTVIWRRGNNEILAAGTNRVTQDRRISVLHDERKCFTSKNICSIASGSLHEN